MLPSRVTITVTGRVQGVGYRVFTAERARALGLSGTVRNLSDGRVVAVAEGRRELLAALIEELQRGPTAARVDDLVVHWGPPLGSETGFRIVDSEGVP